MIRCREIVIKFLNINHHGQRINHTECPGAEFLEIDHGEHFVKISYKNKDGGTLKVLIFNTNNVNEISAEDSVSETTNSNNPGHLNSYKPCS